MSFLLTFLLGCSLEELLTPPALPTPVPITDRLPAPPLGDPTLLTASGTTWLGLYHGLTTKLRGEPWRVEFFESTPDELPALAKDASLILCCKLTKADAAAAPAYVADGGWIPGTAHSVVYFKHNNGAHLIGDPTRGYEVWTTADLETLWTGEGLRLVREERQKP